ncbi:MAG: hypothetical protein HYS57_03235 [Parcubacteria group bacterium]|nr:hypothetical protein [Parcubacteria group bacterium]
MKTTLLVLFISLTTRAAESAAPELPKVFNSPSAPRIVMLGQQRAISAMKLYGGSQPTELTEATFEISLEQYGTPPSTNRLSRILLADRESALYPASILWTGAANGTATVNVPAGALLPTSPAVKELFLLADIPRDFQTGDNITTTLRELIIRPIVLVQLPIEVGPVYYGGAIYPTGYPHSLPITNMVRGTDIVITPGFPVWNTVTVQGLKARIMDASVNHSVGEGTNRPIAAMSVTLRGYALEGSIVRIQGARDFRSWINLRTNYTGLTGVFQNTISLPQEWGRRGFFRVETVLP